VWGIREKTSLLPRSCACPGHLSAVGVSPLTSQPPTTGNGSLTLKPGKEVLELAVTDADKGTALLRLRDDLGAVATVYLGDDRTDEDAFRALSPGDLTVKVGEGETAARYRVADPAAVVRLLETLADAPD
jgi:trehalose-phosphatase